MEKWMNDPNGFIFYKGEYHLFYQHNPFDVVWGPMHWGHAVSKDLTNWDHLDIALEPDHLGAIFSGTTVADNNNCSGLFDDDTGGMIAYYTSHLERDEISYLEVQSMAYSSDNGRTWQKYEGNPIVKNPGIKDFRDPKVFFHKEAGKWVMMLAAGNKVMFYNSYDMKNWEYAGEFGERIGVSTGI
jgi:fructan beta-fructosidase